MKKVYIAHPFRDDPSSNLKQGRQDMQGDYKGVSGHSSSKPPSFILLSAAGRGCYGSLPSVA